MIRKLVFALSLLGACFTGFVHALGLGEAKVISSLNQPLKAEIELVNTRNLELNEILPGLATREEFLKAGVDRIYFLSDIRFEVKPNEKGDLVVLLSTGKPVREPFINFLVEVIWPSGRLLREYALLIDPPLFKKEKARPIQAPVSQQLVSGDVLRITEPEPEPEPVASRSVVRAQPGQYAAGQSYGPTKSKDTLWDIALKARPDRSVTPQQVMLAIQDLNPSAFIHQNINKLKEGVVLRLPTLDQIRQRDRGQAIDEVIVQNEALLPKRTKSVASSANAAPSQQSASAVDSADELKLVVADKQSLATSSANSGESSNTGGTGQAFANEELAVTLEKLDKATIDNNELNNRVSDLEEQLQTLQRLLTLKNDQLATVQEQMRANELASLQADQQVAEVQPGVEPVKKADTEPQKVVSDTGAEEAKTENLLETIINTPLYLGLAAAVLLMLMILLWSVSRRNARKEQEFYARTEEGEDDSLDVEATGAEAGLEEDAEAFDESVPEDDEEIEESERDSEIASEDESEVESQEAQDVIAEADVYVAYGRLDQAVNILEEAISAEPVRTDYRLKLLDVYKESNDVDAFNRQFSELEAIQDADAIEAATQIRNDLLDNQLVALEDKEHELKDHREEKQTFGHDASIEQEQDALDSESLDEAEDELDIDFSSDELDLELDVDLELEEVESDEESDESQTAPVEDSLELDMSSLETDEESLELSPEEEALLTGSEELSIDEELDDIDFSEELDQENEIDLTETIEEAEEAEEAPAADDQSESEEAKGTDTSEQVVSDDILDEAVEAFGDADDLEADLGESEDFDFLDGTDEASTKLDLARAYIDMGDIDGARDILQEVEKEGSSEQQSDAKDLLNSLDSK